MDPAPLLLDPYAFVGVLAVVFVLGLFAGILATPFMPKRREPERHARHENGALFDEPDSVRRIVTDAVKGAKRRNLL